MGEPATPTRGSTATQLLHFLRQTHTTNQQCFGRLRERTILAAPQR